MCGICGVINFGGLTPEDLELFTKVFARSESRGKDACGVGDQRGRTLKAVMPSSRLTEKEQYNNWFLQDVIGQQWVVGHTRHATRGDPKDVINDHPLKIRPRVHLVHNGVVSREDMELPEDTTKTDSYIIAHAINKDWVEGDLFTSVKKAYKRFKGSAAVCVFSQTEIVLAKNINPIRYAVMPNRGIVFASESDFFPEVRPFEIVKDERIIGWDVNGKAKEDKLEVVRYTYAESVNFDWRRFKQSSIYGVDLDDDLDDTPPKEEDYVYRYNPFTRKHEKVSRDKVYGKKKTDVRGWFKQPKEHRKAYYKGRQNGFYEGLSD